MNLAFFAGLIEFLEHGRNVPYAANNDYIHRINAANMYIYELNRWPEFTWDYEKLATKLAEVRYRQGKILGQMNAVGFNLKEEAILQTLTLDVLKSSEIEGDILNPEQVRSSIAKRLGIDIGGLIPADRHVEGVVEMMLDATQKYDAALTEDRLYGWHHSMFPAGYQITTGAWRNGPMQVVSGMIGNEKIHFEAPDVHQIPKKMSAFLNWFNDKQEIDPVIKAGIAHLWFVTIHPFEDGNGRITRAITDMQLAHADQTAQRFYSMSAQIQKERTEYYNILESTQKGSLDITGWLKWFLDCLHRSMDSTDQILGKIMTRTEFWEKHQETQFNVRQLKMVNVLLDDFFGNLNVSKWAKMNNCSTDTALRDINDLVNKNILIKADGGGRNTSYKLKDVNDNT
ncbi:Fic family protein [Chitinophaga sp. YR573]|uniref:Fic family protein n=1 Tax=Chitinophaga sp. YR573 TaxID=1881040 RepID=UPI0008BE9E74|nr:Fic family protein [Chitinophaga sp. YR573]SEV99733.1 Fic family protein [Chitinophaga sp. YR573]